MMTELHEKLISKYKLMPEEGQRNFLCINKKKIRCPSLCIDKPSEDAQLDYLANILVEIFLDKKIYERN